MMSEDIHKWTDGRYTLMFDEHTFFVWDNEKDERMCALETTERLNKQQDTIFKLQDLCGKSDGENAKLRIENKMLEKEVKLLKPTNVEQYEQIVQLQEENEQLRQQQQRLYNYFRDYLEDEMSAENFSEMWDNVKEDERWNDE